MTDQTNQTNQLDLRSIALRRGAHDHRDDGVCLMEAVSWFAGEAHSDRPSCVDPVLAAYGRALNDALDDDERQQLRPLVPLLVGTAGSPELSVRRAYHLVDRHVRYVLPEFMSVLPGRRVRQVARQFAALDPVIDEASAKRAHVLARELRDQIRADVADAADAAAAYDAAAYVVSAARAAVAAAAYADAVADADAYNAAAHASIGTVAYADVAAARAATSAADAARASMISRMIEVYREAIGMR